MNTSELLGAQVVIVGGETLQWTIVWKNTGPESMALNVGAQIGLYPDTPPTQWTASVYKWSLGLKVVTAEPGVEQTTVGDPAPAPSRAIISSALPPGMYDVLYYIAESPSNKIIAYAVHKGEIQVASASAAITAASISKI